MKLFGLGKCWCVATVVLATSLGGCGGDGDLKEGMPKDAATQTGPPDDVKQQAKDMMSAKVAPQKINP